MSQLAPGSLHKFLTGETVTGDDTQIATNLNIPFELLRLAHNDTDTRAKDTYTKSEGDGRYYTKTQLDAGQLDNRYYTESELNAGQLDNRYFTETELNNGQLDNRYYTEAELNAGQLDSRYYTEGEINSILDGISPDGQVFNTKSEVFTATEGQTVFILTQGTYVVGQDRLQVYVQGVKQYLDSGNFAETSPTTFTLSEGVPAGTKIEANWMQGTIVSLNDLYRSTTPPTPVSLANGLQVYNNVQASPLAKVNIKGRTLIDLLGRDGGCESLTNVITNQYGTPTVTLDTTNKVSGTSSIKTVTTTTGHGIAFKVLNQVTNGKSYLVAAMIYVTAGTADFNVVDFSNGNVSVVNPISRNPTTGFVYTYGTFTATATSAEVRPVIRQSGATATTSYIDNVYVYEITSAEKTAIASMTAAQVAAKYPYVDDVKHVNAPYVIKYGENLLPTFNEWESAPQTGDTISITDPYAAIINAATTGGSFLRYYAPAVVGQAYSLSVTTTGSNAAPYMYWCDANKTRLTGTRLTGVNLVAPSGAALAEVVFNTMNPSTYVAQTGTATFTNPMLNLGATAKPFKSRNDDMLAFPNVQLASNVDGTVYDQLFKRDGKYFVERRLKDVVLDGSLSWTFDTDQAGFKGIKVNIGDIITDNSKTIIPVKYDGKVLPFYNFTFTGAQDKWDLDTAAKNFKLFIPDTDSGWGESYTPSAAEIQAYFYNYRMNNGTFGTPYNGSGTKTWTRMDATSNTGSVTTVPTTGASGLLNYKLTYQLATPTFEEIQVDAGMSLHEGLNQIEVGQGIQVREKAIVSTDTGTYFINNDPSLYSAGGNSKLTNRTSKILEVYRNGKVDKKWAHSSNNAYGLDKLTISPANYDPTATYEVSYIALDQYLLSAPVQAVTGEVAANLKTVVDLLSAHDADRDARISALEINKARRVQGQWIAPTLLNGWVNYASSFDTLSYLKDDLGFVHLRGMIKSGTTTAATNIAKLPVGYRPLLNQMVKVALASNVSGTIAIVNNGDIQIDSVTTNTFVAFESSFLAEQ